MLCLGWATNLHTEQDKELFRYSNVHIQILQYGWQVLSQSLIIVAGHKVCFGSKQFIALDKRLANVLCERSDTKYFGFCRPYGLCPNYSLLPLYCKSSHRQSVHEQVWLCFSQTLFIQKAGFGPWATVCCPLSQMTQFTCSSNYWLVI